MISVSGSVICYFCYLFFECFALALDRISPIKLRGLLAEHPRRFALFAGRGEVATVRTAAKIFVQLLLLVGVISLVSAVASLGVRLAWGAGGLVFLGGWLTSEAILLRIVARATPETILRRLGSLFTAASWLLSPLVLAIRWMMPAAPPSAAATDEEIHAFIEAGREEGILRNEDQRLLASIVDFGDTTVKEVMTPRTDLVAVPETLTLAGMADVFLESKHTRLPVYRGTVDRILGVIHVKDAFEAVVRKKEGAIRELARPAHFVPETKKTAELLREFQRRHLAVAIVVDEYGGVAGLVTIEDLLEEIVGEISDEHEDDRDAVVKLADGAVSLVGRTHVDMVRDLFGRGPEVGEFDTVGGFLVSRLGRIPRPGERFEEDMIRFTVEEADRRRVIRVRVEPIAAGQEARSAK